MNWSSRDLTLPSTDSVWAIFCWFANGRIDRNRRVLVEGYDDSIDRPYVPTNRSIVIILVLLEVQSAKKKKPGNQMQISKRVLLILHLHWCRWIIVFSHWFIPFHFSFNPEQKFRSIKQKFSIKSNVSTRSLGNNRHSFVVVIELRRSNEVFLLVVDRQPVIVFPTVFSFHLIQLSTIIVNCNIGKWKSKVVWMRQLLYLIFGFSFFVGEGKFWSNNNGWCVCYYQYNFSAFFSFFSIRNNNYIRWRSKPSSTNLFHL